MEISTLLIYSFAFLILLLIGGMIINGIFIITRGEQEELPDGSSRPVHDMIFYGFYQFIMAEAQPPQTVYYRGHELYRLYKRMVKTMPLPACEQIQEDSIFFEKERTSVSINATVDTEVTNDTSVRPAVAIWREYSRDYLDENNIKAQFFNERIMFYREYKRYRFSKFIRKPLVECLKCMASFWGTLIWWGAVLHFIGYDPIQVPLWILYCFALSYVNTYLFYKAK